MGNLFFNLTLSLQVFRPRTPPDAIDLVSLLLKYTPESRTLPLEACAHEFFDELRDPQTRLPHGPELPPLFNFTTAGMSLARAYISVFLKLFSFSRPSSKSTFVRFLLKSGESGNQENKLINRNQQIITTPNDFSLHHIYRYIEIYIEIDVCYRYRYMSLIYYKVTRIY